MNTSLEKAKEKFENYLKTYLEKKSKTLLDVSTLVESVSYSLLSGGKRFRPLLCCSVGESFDLPVEKVIPFAAAVEFVHTYSLIHDDLPCMDDDSERRGMPTNHVRFGEDVALLAGDVLLTEAFQLLATEYGKESGELVNALAQASGWMGMVRGQILDLGKGKKTEKLEDLIHLHQLKTGQLIALCFQGPAILAQKSSKEYFDFGLKLGLAFQIKDDLLDADKQETTSFLTFMGFEETQNYLSALTVEIQDQRSALDLKGSSLDELISFNLNRSL